MRLLALFALLAGTPAFAQVTPPPDYAVIHAGTLLDRPGRAPRRNASVIVRGGRIEAVQDGFVTPAGARVIDLRDRFVLPGLIDSHVHLSSDRAGNEGLLAGFTDSPQLGAYEAAWNANKTLDAGFYDRAQFGRRRRDAGVARRDRSGLGDGAAHRRRWQVDLDDVGPHG